MGDPNNNNVNDNFDWINNIPQPVLERYVSGLDGELVPLRPTVADPGYQNRIRILLEGYGHDLDAIVTSEGPNVVSRIDEIDDNIAHVRDLRVTDVTNKNLADQLFARIINIRGTLLPVNVLGGKCTRRSKKRKSNKKRKSGKKRQYSRSKTHRK